MHLDGVTGAIHFDFCEMALREEKTPSQRHYFEEHLKFASLRS